MDSSLIVPIILWDGPPSHPITCHATSVEKSIMCTGSKTGQLVLWHIMDDMKKGKIQPFVVLISEGSPIKIVQICVSNFGEEIFVSISEDGSFAVWDVRDGRCIANQSKLIKNVISPEKAIVFEDGRFLAISGNGPELDIINIWLFLEERNSPLSVTSLYHTHGDWVSSLTSFNARGERREAVKDKPMSNSGLLSIDTSSRSFDGRDVKFCFISVSSDNRLYIWEILVEEREFCHTNFEIKNYAIVNLDYSSSGMFTESDDEHSNICDISMSPKNDIILLVRKNSIGLLHRFWLSQAESVIPLVFKIEDELLVVHHNSTKTFSTTSRWKGGTSLGSNFIELHTTDGRVFFYELPIITSNYDKHFSTLSKELVSPSEQVSRKPVLRKRFIENEKSLRQRIFASREVGFDSIVVTNCISNLKSGEAKSWCIRSFGDDELTLWRIDSIPPLANIQEAEIKIMDVPPSIVGSLSAHWGDHQACSSHEESKVKCTATSIGIGDSSRASKTTCPLPGVIARGYSNGNISVAILPTDQEPFLITKENSINSHTGVVTCLQILHRTDVRRGYVLISGGADGKVFFWWIEVKTEEIWRQRRPYFDVSLCRSFRSHQLPVYFFSSPKFDQQLSPRTTLVASVGDDKSVCIFSVYLPEDKMMSAPEVECEFNLKGHSGNVKRVLWKCKEGFLISLCADGIAFVWQLSSGHLERRVRASTLFRNWENSKSSNETDSKSAEGLLGILKGGKEPTETGRRRLDSLAPETDSAFQFSNNAQINRKAQHFGISELVSLESILDDDSRKPSIHVLHMNARNVAYEIQSLYQKHNGGVCSINGALNLNEMPSNIDSKLLSMYSPPGEDNTIDSRSPNVTPPLSTPSPPPSPPLTPPLEDDEETARNSSVPTVPVLDDSCFLHFHNTVITLLLSWGIDEHIDSLITSELGLEKPTIDFSFGIKGEGGTLSLAVPSFVRGSNKWNFSPYLSGLHSITLVAMWIYFMNNAFDDATRQSLLSNLVTFYGISVAEKLRPNYQEPALELLARFMIENWEEGNLAANLLLKDTVAKMPEYKRVSLAAEYSARLLMHHVKASSRNSENNILDIWNYSPDNTIGPHSPKDEGFVYNTDHRDPFKRLSAAISPRSSLNGPNASFISGSRDLDLLVIIIGFIGIEHPEDIAPPTAKIVSENLRRYLLTGNSIYTAFSAELIGKGLILWRPHISDMNVIIVKLLHLSLNSHSNVRGASDSVSNAAHRALLEIGIYEPLLFINTLGNEAWTLGESDVYHSHSIMMIVDLIRKHPSVLLNHLPPLVEAIIRALDPSEPSHRKGIIKASTRALHELTKKFPMISFHQDSQRFSVGTVESVIIIYDLRTATKWKVLTGHAGSVSCLSFSENGEQLLSYSYIDASVRCWQVAGGGFFSSFSMTTKSCEVKQLPPTGAQCSFKDALANCKIEFVGKGSLRLCREDCSIATFGL